MLCIFCGRICDMHPSHTCVECQKEIDRNNERVYILSLLKEAYEEVYTIRLREKIERILYVSSGNVP